MQFQLVALLSIAAFVSAKSVEETSTAVVSETTTTTSSIEDCASTVTNCPAKSHTTTISANGTTVAYNLSSSSNGTVVTPTISSYEGAGKALYAQAGVAAFAGVAALLL